MLLHKNTTAKVMNRAQNKPIAPSQLGIDHHHSLDARCALTAKVQLQIHYLQVCNNLEISLEKDLL